MALTPATKQWIRRARGISAAILTLALAGAASGQCGGLAKLVPSDGAAWDNAGHAVALDGSLAVVSAHQDDDTVGDSGSVYVYRFDGAVWVEEAKLHASDPAVGDRFGWALAVQENAGLGDVIVVGARYDDDGGADSGSAYVFRYSGSAWVQEKKLTASDAAQGDGFGADVAVDGDFILIGSVADNHAGTDNGSAYVYKRHPVLGWLEEKKLTASDSSDLDYFGSHVAIDGNVALVSAASDDPINVDSGSAYVFRRVAGSWGEEQKLVPSDGAAWDYFGSDLALDNNVAVLSSPVDDDLGTDSGSVYVFRHNGTSWSEEQKLIAPDGVAYDHFGRSIDVEAGVIVVGAPLTDHAGLDTGALYTYVSKNKTWAFDQKLAPSDVAASDWCGHSVAMSGTRALGASPLDDDKGTDSGSVNVFSVGEFVLDITPAAVSPGDAITMQASCGTPGSPVILVTTDVNGVPFFYMFLYFYFSADHSLTLSTPAPTGLAGSDIGFLAFKFDAFGKVAASNSDRLLFQ